MRRKKVHCVACSQQILLSKGIGIMRLNRIRLAVLSAIAAQAGVVAQTALAQESNELAEVMVTATRRSTDVQDIPLAVTALSGDSLEQQNIEGLEDLTGIIPNVLIAGDNTGTTGGSFYMRGIPNVGVYLDGIWQVSNNGLLTRDFVELDRVEVLRGPQGTLYGRDSTGGSIHMHSKKPAKEFGLTGSLQVGNLDRRDVMFSADIPIGEKLQTKWTIGKYSQDGWVRSLTTGVRDGKMDSQVLRGDLLFTPTDNLSFRLIHQRDDQVGRQARVQARIDFNVAYFHGYQVGIAEAHDIASGGRFNALSAVAGAPGGQLGEYESLSSSTSPNEQYLKQTTLHGDWDINENMHLKYMFGDSSVDASIYNDWGGSQYNFFVNYDTSRLDLQSHELQLTGDLFSKKLNYVVGAYKWEQASRNRGVEWTMQDWTLAAPNAGTIHTLNYADVLASPACQKSPASVGRSFIGQVNVGLSTPGNPFFITGNTNGATDWPFPCNWAGGGGWIGAFAGPGGGITSDRLNGQTQDGQAFFGEATWDINDRWDVTAGYRRHSQDNQAVAMSGATRNALGVVTDIGQLARNIASGATEARPVQLDTLFRSRARAVAGTLDVSTPTSFSANTIRLATTFDINEDIMVYAGYSEGFNSGGVSQYEDNLGAVSIPYSPETIENIEVGLRADLFSRTLRANVTAFRTDWLGIQYLGTVIDRVTGQEATELVLQNSANGRAQGVEFELTWLATDSLRLGANLGFLDTSYLSINPGAPIPPNSAFARAPEKTYNFNAQYKWENVAGGRLAARLESNYWGAYWRASTLELRQDFQGLQNKPEAGDIWQHNARLSWTPSSDKYEVSLWANNITDTYSYNSGFMHGIWQFDFATVDRPREFGLMVKARF
jgi:iron complex outermembrane recepter protein